MSYETFYLESIYKKKIFIKFYRMFRMVRRIIYLRFISKWNEKSREMMDGDSKNHDENYQNLIRLLIISWN